MATRATMATSAGDYLNELHKEMAQSLAQEEAIRLTRTQGAANKEPLPEVRELYTCLTAQLEQQQQFFAEQLRSHRESLEALILHGQQQVSGEVLQELLARLQTEAANKLAGTPIPPLMAAPSSADAAPVQEPLGTLHEQQAPNERDRADTTDTASEEFGTMMDDIRGFASKIKSTAENLSPAEMLQHRIEKTADKVLALGPLSAKKDDTGLAAVVNSKSFNNLCLGVIFINTIYTVVLTDKRARGTFSATTFAEIAELSFAAWYSLEMIAKLLVYRFAFFTNDDALWNIFDLVVVVWSILEFVVQAIIEAKILDLSFLRVMRVLRVVRIFRAFRFLNELRQLVNNMLGSLVPLMWATMLLMLVLLVFSLIFVECMNEYLSLDGAEVDDTTKEMIGNHFGSVWRALITLFKSTTGGDDWGPIYDLVSHAGILYSLIFLFFQAFFLFAFVNTVTSIFVDKAISMARDDNDANRLKKEQEQMTAAQSLKQMLHQFDHDGNGTLSWRELHDLSRNEHIKARLEGLDLNVNDADHLFKMVSDLAGSDEVEIDLLVASWLKMKGFATSIDVQAVILQIHRLTDTVRHVACRVGCEQVVPGKAVRSRKPTGMLT